jgi:hypothetical protein
VALPPARSGRAGAPLKGRTNGAPVEPRRPLWRPRTGLDKGETGGSGQGAPLPLGATQTLAASPTTPAEYPLNGGRGSATDPPALSRAVNGRGRACRGRPSARAQDIGRQVRPAAGAGRGRDCYAAARVGLPPARLPEAGGTAGAPDGAPLVPPVAPRGSGVFAGKKCGSGRGHRFLWMSWRGPPFAAIGSR